MSLYPHILVPVDPSGGSWDVVAEAGRLARALGSRVTLLHVLDTPAESATVHQLLTDGARHSLHDLAALVPGGAATVVRDGEPVDTILAAIADLQPDLVVCGTHARTGLLRAPMGSVAEGVLRRSPVPVLVVRGADSGGERPAEAWLLAQLGGE